MINAVTEEAVDSLLEETSKEVIANCVEACTAHVSQSSHQIPSTSQAPDPTTVELPVSDDDSDELDDEV